MRINNIKGIFSVSVALLFVSGSCAQKKATNTDQTLLETIDHSFGQAAGQYKYMKSLTDADRFPKNYENGRLVTSSASDWTRGVYPGTLLYLYGYTKEEELLRKAEHKVTILEGQEDNNTTHALGCMMYCSFGSAYRLTQKEEYEDIIVQSAQ